MKSITEEKKEEKIITHKGKTKKTTPSFSNKNKSWDDCTYVYEGEEK
jgi:hypothetical protein